jgi:hypothetical protein
VQRIYTSHKLNLFSTGKATLIVPSDLAYGDVGSDIVPPGATLKFDVELIQVVQQSPTSIADMGESEVITLPGASRERCDVVIEVPRGLTLHWLLSHFRLVDGTKMTVPKGVKMRVVSQEEEET